MKLETFDTKKSVSLPTELVLTVTKAINTSPYAGVAWLISYGNDQTKVGSSMIGYPQSSLLSDLESVTDAVSLYLSCAPHSFFINFDDLIYAAKQANINTIHLPKISKDSFKNKIDKQLEIVEGIKIQHYDIGDAGSKLHQGAHILRTRKRPRVTCITAANSIAESVPFSYFDEDFSISHHIRSTIEQSHALVLDSQLESSKYEIRKNVAMGEITHYSLSSIEDLLSIFKIQYLLEQPTLTILCGPALTCKLLALDYVDEVIYHCQLFGKIESSENSPEPKLIGPLPGWKVRECRPLRNGVRVSFSR